MICGKCGEDLLVIYTDGLIEYYHRSVCIDVLTEEER